jgi:hypothetical protein
LIIGGRLGVGLETGASIGVEGIAGVGIVVAVGVNVIDGSVDAGGGVSLGCAVVVTLTDGAGVSAEGRVSAGEEVGLLLADGDGAIFGVGEPFLFFRCFGVGVGRTKSLFSF